MRRSLSIIFAVLIVAIGCHSIGLKDVEGDWILRDSSRSVLPSGLKDAKVELMLNSDGTFVAKEMPGLFFVPDQHAARLETGSGSWRLISSEGRQQIELEFNKISNWNEELPYGIPLEIGRGKLFYFIGDPDEGRRVSLERK